MRHKLAGHIDVDNLNMEVGIEMHKAMTEALYPSVNKKMTGGGGKHKLIKDARHSYKRDYHAAYQHACRTEQSPTEHLKVVPKGHSAHFIFCLQLFLFLIIRHRIKISSF